MSDAKVSEDFRYGEMRLSDSVQTALSYAANCIQQDHGTSNGRTALYWHLVSIAHQHLGDRS